MKKIFFLLILSVIVFNPPLVFGQALTERWTCLKALHCRPHSRKIPAGFENEEFTDCQTVVDGHGAKISEDPAAPPLANQETYIIECIGTDEGQTCTTGSAATDQIVYGRDNRPERYTFRSGPTQPVMSGANGEIGPYEWSSKTGMAAHKFLALNYVLPQPTAGPTAPVLTGEVGALQQGTIGFSAISQGTFGEDKDCVSLRWDPYGVVFDSQSLEPVMNASVNLSMKRGDGSYSPVTTADVLGGNITNPQTTLEDGAFSFVVDDGSYKLAVTGAGFPVTDLNLIHPNYGKIYTDIYPAATGEEIVQAGTIEHRDIPVSVAVPVNNPAKMMEYFYQTNALTQIITIEGRVSHPLAVINFYSVKPSSADPDILSRYRQVKQIQSDSRGNFKAEIDSSTFEINESFGEAEIIKTDLRQLAQKKPIFWLAALRKLIGEIMAQGLSSTTIKFSPIATYLEGYAYDSSGRKMPNAGVGIYLTFSNKPYYQTTADSKGYFKIASENMPKIPYRIRYTAVSGATVTITTSDFIVQNQEYLADKKIKLSVFKNDKGKVLTKKDLPPKTPTSGFFRGSGVGAGQPGQTPQGSNLLILIGLLLFMLISVAVILAVYLIRKRHSTAGQINP